MPRTIRIICLLIVVAAIAQSSTFAAADPLSLLDSAAKSNIQAVDEWSYKIGDVPGGERPDFDDSNWKVASPDFSYGDGPVAWARKRIVVPEKVRGFSTAGSRIALDFSVDDVGEVYINGVFSQRFNWEVEEGRITLTESAKPGETIVVAVKMINKHGPGRFIRATLDIDSTKQVADMARRLGEDYRLAEVMSKLLPEAATPQCRTALSGCLGLVDFTALDRGDAQAFAKSVHAATDALAPFSRIAQLYRCDLVGHAHIDMNWLWLWPETVEVCQNTFASVTQLMDQYPEFTFSQSQPTTYKAVQDTMPKLFAKILRHVKEGRWEVTGGTWVENDMNMASGESIVRQILYAKRYFRENFGVEPELCWMPDTFGHPWTMPQIAKKSGLKYYFFARCNPGRRVFWWQGPDGSRVLAFDAPYNGAVDDFLPERMLRNAGDGAKDIAHVYGVGDHGGGPTKRDIENVSELRKRAVVPQFKFSSAGEFFRRALSQKRDYPVYDQELNFVFQGCYTSHGDIKLMNRKSENLLPAAEAFASIASKFGKAYPAEGFRASWQDACFNQFHDILCGTAIHASYDYSRGLFEKLQKQADTDLESSLKCLVDRVDTRGEGIPIVVFNPLAWSRTDVAEIACPYSEKDGQMYVADAWGRKLPAQRLGDRIIFLAREVPSLGYSTFWLRRGSLPMSPGSGARGASDSSTCRIENEYLCVEVNRKTGAISSIFDKLANRRVLGAGRSGGVLQALAEAPVDMSAWKIGRIESTTELSKVRVVEPLQLGPVSSSVRIDQMFKSSLFAQDVILYAGVPRLDIHLTADWREVGSAEKGSTMMKVAFPVNVNDGKATFEIPFGSIQRKADGAEVPAQKWIDLSGNGYGVSLLNNCKYGHDVNGSTMRLTLLRNSYEPDPKPDVGIHDMTYSVYPHSGDWRKAGTVRRAYELNNPLIACPTSTHPGTFLRTRCFVGIKPNNLIVTAFKKAEDGDGYILRFYESSGFACHARVWVDPAFKSWSEVNLVEEPMGKRGGVNSDRGISIAVGKWEIKTLRLR